MTEKKLGPAQPLKRPSVVWPNWRVPKEYPSASTPLEGWAWEFLRRNACYQKQWNLFVNKTPQLGHAAGPPFNQSAEVKKGEVLAFFDPPIQKGEAQSDWRRRVIASGREPVGPLPMATGLALGWGLEEMFNAAFSWNHVENLKFRPRFRPRPHPTIRYYVGHIDDWAPETVSSRAMWPLPAPQGSALLQIDLDRPIKAQLDRALPFLEGKRGELVAEGLLDPGPLKGPKTSEYPSLLRVFDAYKAKENSAIKIDNSEIADVLHGKNKGSVEGIAKKYAHAAAFVNKGYLRLLP